MNAGPNASLLIDARPATIGVRGPVEVVQAVSALLPRAITSDADAWIDITHSEHDQFFVAGPDTGNLSPSMDRTIEEVVSQLNRLHVRHSPDVLHLHAGAATWEGATVLISGSSTSGKSTLVTALCDRGFGYVTDECADISKAGEVDGWHKPVSLRPGGRELVATHTAGRYALLPHRPRIETLEVVLVLEPESDSPPRAIHRADAVLSLIGESLDFGRRPGDLRWLAGLVSATTTFRLGRSELSTMCDNVIETIHEARRSLPGECVELDLLTAPRPNNGLCWAPSCEGVRIDDRTMLFARTSRQVIVIDGSTDELIERLRAGVTSDDLRTIGIEEDFVATLIALGHIDATNSCSAR